MSGLSMEEFNINELAGATGLILGAVSGILVVIFKSRCYCKFRIGFSDNCNICMCERKPPPDPVDSDDETKPTNKDQPTDTPTDQPTDKPTKPPIQRTQSEQLVPEPEIEKLV